jgi:uncharacterized membrane protein
MKTLRLALTWIFALLLLAAGINHFARPQLYEALIPHWLPMVAVNYLTGFVEAVIGMGLLFTISRRAAAIAAVLLMVSFLPVHLIDAFRSQPAIGSVPVAWARFLFQFVLIYWAWFLVPPAKAR